jgi:hypothetical protein
MVVHADPQEVMAEAVESLRVRLTNKVAAYEVMFDLASADLRHALDSGAVPDTHETCDWLIAWEALDALGRGGGPTRLE